MVRRKDSNSRPCARSICLIAMLALMPCGITSGETSTVVRPTTLSSDNPQYIGVAMGRARSAVNRAKLEDPAKAARIQQYVGNFYIMLENAHKRRDAQIASLPPGSEAEEAGIRSKADELIDRNRVEFLAELALEQLTPDQVAAIKDGMTHNSFNGIYRQYEIMLPELTERQKAVIRAYLGEARDKALIRGTAPEKIDLFNVEYRAKIDRYLVGQGYDVATAKAAYDQRVAAERAARAATQQAATQPVN